MASYAGSRSAVTDDYAGDAGVGWIGFAAVMLGLAGTWNLIDGLLAVGTSRVYVGHQTFVFSDLNTWGWIITILGVTQLLAAFAIVRGSQFGRWFGVAVAAVNSIGQLFFVPAYPLWSLAMFAVDLIIIYALVVYGGSRVRTN